MLYQKRTFDAWWMVVVLFLAAIISFLDRGIIGLVVGPLRRDLRISEFQIGLLQGLSFGLFYASVGLFLGLGADRWPRRRLLMVGIGAWSTGTIMCGLSTSYLEIFLWRLLVGAGEATLVPVAVSLIGDLFDPARRGAPLSLFFLGISIAGGLAAAVTGILLTQVPNEFFSSIPGLADLSPWRRAFVLCGGSGLFLIPLLLTTVEPARQYITTREQRVSLKTVALYFKSNSRVFLPFYLGFTLITAGQYSLGAWGPSMLIRQFGVSAATAGKLLGTLSMIGGMASALSAAFVIDKVTVRFGRSAKLLVLGATAFGALPCAFAVFMPSVFSAAFALACMSLAYPLASICFSATVQDLLPSNMRGVAMAAALLVNTVIASTVGTMMVALTTQYIFRNDTFVGYSMALIIVPSLLASSVLFLVAYRASHKSRFQGI